MSLPCVKRFNHERKCLSPVLKYFTVNESGLNNFTMKESASPLCKKILPWIKVPLPLVKNFNINIPSPAGILTFPAFKIIIIVCLYGIFYPLTTTFRQSSRHKLNLNWQLRFWRLPNSITSWFKFQIFGLTT